jgi:hypothetical protein
VCHGGIGAGVLGLCIAPLFDLKDFVMVLDSGRGSKGDMGGSGFTKLLEGIDVGHVLNCFRARQGSAQDRFDSSTRSSDTLIASIAPCAWFNGLCPAAMQSLVIAGSVGKETDEREMGGETTYARDLAGELNR